MDVRASFVSLSPASLSQREGGANLREQLCCSTVSFEEYSKTNFNTTVSFGPDLRLCDVTKRRIQVGWEGQRDFHYPLIGEVNHLKSQLGNTEMEIFQKSVEAQSGCGFRVWVTHTG